MVESSCCPMNPRNPRVSLPMRWIWSSAGMRGRGNKWSQRKPAEKRHRTARFPHAKIRNDPAGNRTRWEASSVPRCCSGQTTCLSPRQNGFDSRRGGIVTDDASGRRGFLGDLPFPKPPRPGAAPYSPQSPSSTFMTSLLRAAKFNSLFTRAFSLVHIAFDTSWRTPAQSSPPTVTADNQCAVDISIFVHKTVASSLQGSVRIPSVSPGDSPSGLPLTARTLPARVQPQCDRHTRENLSVVLDRPAHTLTYFPCHLWVFRNRPLDIWLAPGRREAAPPHPVSPHKRAGVDKEMNDGCCSPASPYWSVLGQVKVCDQLLSEPRNWRRYNTLPHWEFVNKSVSIELNDNNYTNNDNYKNNGKEKKDGKNDIVYQRTARTREELLARITYAATECKDKRVRRAETRVDHKHALTGAEQWTGPDLTDTPTSEDVASLGVPPAVAEMENQSSATLLRVLCTETFSVNSLFALQRHDGNTARLGVGAMRHWKCVLLSPVSLPRFLTSDAQLYSPLKASLLHWLLPVCEVTPFLSNLHVIGAHDCEVFIYWRRVSRGVSNKEWSNDKRIAKENTLASNQGKLGSILGRVTGFSQVRIVPVDAVDRRVFSGISGYPRPLIPALLHIHFNHPHRLSRPCS
ncbi:hypothetical protein PR048_022966 [Dryococelus australis]|uniref:Uncharacterized protein n=1 Tax=Dryococelus australis TaxID=614101 RepID=A0ABQ9GSU3_9NEOP|nr:hypothetical protein PR048_022966 [Dryococelus australis]